MQPDEITPGSPQDWLARAEGHLALAKQPKPARGFWEDLAFHAQQAAELAIKAVCQQHQQQFPFTHNIDDLIECLKGIGIVIPNAVEDAVSLTRYAVRTRYPGMSLPVTREEYESAILLAQGVLDWAQGTMKPQSSS